MKVSEYEIYIKSVSSVDVKNDDLFEEINIDSKVVREFIKDFNVRFNYKEKDGYKITIASVLLCNDSNNKIRKVNNKNINTDFIENKFNYTHCYCAGHSYCSPRDKFDKKLGRFKALERLIMNIYSGKIFILDEFEITYNFLKNDLFNLFCIFDFDTDIDKNILPYKILDNDMFARGISLLDLMIYRLEKSKK